MQQGRKQNIQLYLSMTLKNKVIKQIKAAD